MKHRPATFRKTLDLSIRVIATVAACTGVFFLGWILLEVTRRGLTAINWEFFTALPAPPGAEGGGLASAIIGTLIITVLATAIGVPLGIMAGVYLSEVGRGNRLSNVIRFTTNVLMGIPSIIMGLFVYSILVRPFGHFSGIAGAVALALIILPVVGRTAEDMLSLVPNALRESALALGAPRWKTTTSVVFRAARTGMTTGVLLAVARVSGETAPLLFTALNSPYWPTDITGPTSNLTVTIFNYAMSPYPEWQTAAWGASLLIMISVLLATIVARTMTKEHSK
jgi:phosphate transport system permease protein